MEFYGNSVSAGYAVDDLSGRDLHDSIYTNNYKSYAALTARHYDAKYHCICKSGIGVTVSWDSLIMPEIYDKLIPTNSSSFWDFSNYSPDIVVVNLFQNDFLVKEFGTEASKSRSSGDNFDFALFNFVIKTERLSFFLTA